jgi:3-oxoacyl-[acyl-carrier protein] reductase
MSERDIAIVTGGGRGIGRAAAAELAARGLDVVIFGRVAGDLVRAAEEIAGARGARVVPIECDVASSHAVDEAASHVLRALGTPRVVVNNAGVVERARVEDTSEGVWDHVLDVNLKGPFLVTKAFLPAMKAKGRGRIVHVSSISATLGTPKLSAYCASKWGLLGFTKSLAEELRGTGLQTMAVLPGSVDTAMLEGSGFAPQMPPADVARTITWLALEAPDAMNGSAVEVFGP